MHQIHPITADNRKGFSFYEEIARKPEVFVYFALHQSLQLLEDLGFKLKTPYAFLYFNKY